MKSVCYLLFKSSIISQFNYCLIVWVCFGFGRGLNNIINGTHERALSIVYQDKKISFETLLKLDKFVSVHMRNTHIWLLKWFK